MILINILISLTWLGIIIFLALLIFACITFAICLATYWLGKIALMMCDWLDRLTKGSLKIAITDDGVTVNAKSTVNREPKKEIPVVKTTAPVINDKSLKQIAELDRLLKLLSELVKGLEERIVDLEQRFDDIEYSANQKGLAL